jgi:hypothetical protein
VNCGAAASRAASPRRALSDDRVVFLAASDKTLASSSSSSSSLDSETRLIHKTNPSTFFCLVASRESDTSPSAKLFWFFWEEISTSAARRSLKVSAQSATRCAGHLKTLSDRVTSSSVDSAPTVTVHRL